MHMMRLGCRRGSPSGHTKAQPSNTIEQGWCGKRGQSQHAPAPAMVRGAAHGPVCCKDRLYSQGRQCRRREQTKGMGALPCTMSSPKGGMGLSSEI